MRAGTLLILLGLVALFLPIIVDPRIVGALVILIGLPLIWASWRELG